MGCQAESIAVAPENNHAAPNNIGSNAFSLMAALEMGLGYANFIMYAITASMLGFILVQIPTNLLIVRCIGSIVQLYLQMILF
jgi:hypothetical protein